MALNNQFYDGKVSITKIQKTKKSFKEENPNNVNMLKYFYLNLLLLNMLREEITPKKVFNRFTNTNYYKMQQCNYNEGKNPFSHNPFLTS